MDLLFGRVAFVGLLIFLALFGVASLIGHPGPFVFTSFSIAGLPVWASLRGSRWIVALVLAAVTSALPVFLLVSYDEGSVLIDCVVTVILSYGLAWGGMMAGRVVWLPRERRR